MKTVEQLIFEKRFKDAIFNPNDFNDWAKENEYEAYNLCLLVAKQLESDRKLQNKRLVYEFAKWLQGENFTNPDISIHDWVETFFQRNEPN